MSYHFDFCLISGQSDVGFNSEVFFKDFRTDFPDISIEFNTIPDRENLLFFFNTFPDRIRTLGFKLVIGSMYQ